MDYIKLSQVGTPVASAIPDVVSLLEQLDISSGSWYAVINLANAFSVPVHNAHQKV